MWICVLFYRTCKRKFDVCVWVCVFFYIVSLKCYFGSMWMHYGWFDFAMMFIINLDNDLSILISFWDYCEILFIILIICFQYRNRCVWAIETWLYNISFVYIICNWHDVFFIGDRELRAPPIAVWVPIIQPIKRQHGWPIRLNQFKRRRENLMRKLVGISSKTKSQWFTMCVVSTANANVSTSDRPRFSHCHSYV